MRIVLVRHPETQANVEGLIYGKTASKYTLLGEKQLQVVAKHALSFPITKIIASPLQRALKLGKAIGDALELPVETHESLEEMNYGMLEGLTYHEAKVQHPDVYDALMSDDFTYQVEGGESYQMFLGRVHRFLDAVIESYDSKEQTVMLVTHGGVIRTALEYLVEGSEGFSWSMNVENGVMIDLIQEGDRFIINNLLNIEENEL